MVRLARRCCVPLRSAVGDRPALRVPPVRPLPVARTQSRIMCILTALRCPYLRLVATLLLKLSLLTKVRNRQPTSTLFKVRLPICGFGSCVIQYDTLELTLSLHAAVKHQLVEVSLIGLYIQKCSLINSSNESTKEMIS